MGDHHEVLAYPTVYDMAYSMVFTEAGHYEALCRYIDVMGLRKAFQSISRDPADCRAFAAGYNGPAFRRYCYDEKLAEAMR